MCRKWSHKKGKKSPGLLWHNLYGLILSPSQVFLLHVSWKDRVDCLSWMGETSSATTLKFFSVLLLCYIKYKIFIFNKNNFSTVILTSLHNIWFMRFLLSKLKKNTHHQYSGTKNPQLPEWTCLCVYILAV